MKISTESWHYRFISKHVRSYRIPTNLCPYMRLLVWLGIKRSVELSVRGGFYLLCAAVAVAPILLLVHNFCVEFLPASWLVTGKDEISLFQMLAGMGIICYGIAGVVLGVALGVELTDRYKNSDYARNRRLKKDETLVLPPKEPSVVAAWWKDFHDKTCTPLEFVDVPE